MLKKLRDMPQIKRDITMAIVMMVVMLMSSLFASDSVTDFLSRMVVYMLFASAVNIILGFGGLRPLGQATYFGFSAYAYVFMVVRMHLSIGVALPLALIMNLVLAAFIGTLCLRANDDMAFAFMNMGINTLLWTLIQKMQVVGSDTGITGSVRLPFASSVKANFYLTFFVVVICLLLIYLFFRSPFAKMLKGSRENLERLTFIGVNTRNVRLVAYMVSALFCGIAGLLYSMRNMGAFPSMISANTSLDGLIMCLVGGMYSFFGPVIGAAIITVINVQLPILTMYYQAVAGVIIVFCVLFLQGGLLRDKATLELDKNKRILAKKGGIKA
jgi:branched-chain amino acid transport system permease protein